MSLKAMVWAFGVKCPSPTAKLVLVKICENANEETMMAWPSREHIARQVQVSTRTVTTTIQQLAEAGLLSVEPRYVEGRQTSNIYNVHYGAGEPVETGVEKFAHRGEPASSQGGSIFQGGVKQLPAEPSIEPPREPLEASPPVSVEAPAAKRTKGTRIPAGWEPDEADKQYARGKGLSWQEITFQAEKFVNFWESKPGAQGVKVKWDATWRNWILSYIERNGVAGARPGKANDPNAFGVYGYANGASKPRRPQADDMRALCYE